MMNKRLNTVLFILLGTVVNLLLALFCIGALLFGASFLGPRIGIQVSTLIPFAFIIGILLAIFAYQRFTIWVITRFKLTDKLEPFFTSRHKTKVK